MRRLLTHTLVIGTMLGAWAFGEQTSPQQRSRALEVKGLAVPFKGITANGPWFRSRSRVERIFQGLPSRSSFGDSGRPAFASRTGSRRYGAASFA